MTGPLGVMAVVLLETAAGCSLVLWLGGVWGAVRRGFFLLAGAMIAMCALGAWAVARAELARAQMPWAGRAGTGLAVLAGLSVLWPILLLARRPREARVVGLAATAVGLVTLGLLGAVRGQAALRGTLELGLGALILGSTVYGLLLGHWYLVERRLDGRHMVRSSWWYIAGVLAAAVAVALSSGNAAPTASTAFSPLLAIPGLSAALAGGLLAICALIAGFVYKLAREGGRSIQAATGMFYLAVIMAFSAELSAKIRFFSPPL
jgi:hypothetical protein